MALSRTARQRTSLAQSTIAEMDEESTTSDVVQASVQVTNQRSRAEIPSRGMGSKTASLYLTRSTSLMQSTKPNLEPSKDRTPEVDAGSQEGQEIHSSSSSKKTSVASLPREFTFTGYDIMADGT